NTNGTRVFNIRMYVIDASGNYDYCTTTIIITDNDEVCDSTAKPIIVGGEVSLYIDSKSKMEQSDLWLYNLDLQTLEKQKTDLHGRYAFEDIVISGNYSVAPQFDGNPLQGVSTKDLIAIQQHLLGNKPFDQGYQFIAADVDRNNKISAKDMLELRKLILGVYDNFAEIDPDQTSWRFHDRSMPDLGLADPWTISEGKI